MDRYADFAELKRNEKEGEDYTILSRYGSSDVAVMAPHGGGIEPGTVDIADAVAGGDHTFYGFKGIKRSGNRVLHITSNRFDEPVGQKIAKSASVVVSIHGSRDPGEIVFVGGLNRALKKKMVDALQGAGFSAVTSDLPGLRGIGPGNICNRCKSGQGVQLEISRGLREKMFDALERRRLRRKTEVFYRFVAAIRRALHARKAQA